jgi:hypothetical protein
MARRFDRGQNGQRARASLAVLAINWEEWSGSRLGVLRRLCTWPCGAAPGARRVARRLPCRLHHTPRRHTEGQQETSCTCQSPRCVVNVLVCAYAWCVAGRVAATEPLVNLDCTRDIMLCAATRPHARSTPGARTPCLQQARWFQLQPWSEAHLLLNARCRAQPISQPLRPAGRSRRRRRRRCMSIWRPLPRSCRSSCERGSVERARQALTASHPAVAGHVKPPASPGDHEFTMLWQWWYLPLALLAWVSVPSTHGSPAPAAGGAGPRRPPS